jgi:hypothetical protein
MLNKKSWCIDMHRQEHKNANELYTLTEMDHLEHMMQSTNTASAIIDGRMRRCVRVKHPGNGKVAVAHKM